MKPLLAYQTPDAFRSALDTHLRFKASREGVLFARQRQLFVFGRFLARLTQRLKHAITLKGGLALELPIDRARTTKDIDLRLAGTAKDLLNRLQDCGRLDLGDWLRFEVQPNKDHPEITDEAVKYDGWRFRAKCFLGQKRLAEPFGVDVVMGGPMLREPEWVSTDASLGVEGIASPLVRVLAVETHIAEKLHAYTGPIRNSRVKDLPDLALPASAGVLSSVAIRNAVAQTFAFRDTHPVPTMLPAPPFAGRRTTPGWRSKMVCRGRRLAK